MYLYRLSSVALRFRQSSDRDQPLSLVRSSTRGKSFKKVTSLHSKRLSLPHSGIMIWKSDETCNAGDTTSCFFVYPRRN